MDPGFERWLPPVYAYFRRRVADDETAEDLTSETFERILRALPRFSPRGDVERATRVWVYRIAGNVYKNTLRRWGRRGAHDAALAEGAPAAVEERAGLEHALMVRRAMAALEAGDRDILTLRYWDGLTAREIAEVVGMAQREVYTALERCHRQLRRTLGAPESEVDDAVN